MRYLLLSLGLASAMVCGPALAQPDYDAEAIRAMEAFDSTGLTVAVSIDGEIVHQGVYGKANEATDALITTDMLFPIASISKAFTTTALAILVDRGDVEWDAPLQAYIPEFQMSDPWVSENFTVRDALTHRSGLPLGAGDLLFVPDGKPSVEDIISALAFLEPSSGFRSEYAYDNLLYVVAGEVVTRVSGEDWSDFITEEILKPVGMDSCAADISRIRPDHAVVTGHERAAGAEEGVPIDERQSFGPSMAAAGGIYCTTGDMMTWAQFWIDGGVTATGERLISEEQAEEVWSGVTPTNTRKVLKQSGLTQQTVYGLGWVIQDFDGTLMLSHGGGFPGVVSGFYILPKEKMAIFASANDYRAAARAFSHQIADGLIGDQSFDFIGTWGNLFNEAIEEAVSAVSGAVTAPEGAASPGVPFEQYAGLYRDPWYGDMTVHYGDDGLSIDMGRSELLDGPLTHYDGDRFAAIWPNRTMNADAFVTFTMEDGQVIGARMEAISELTDFSYDFHDLKFEKVPAESDQ
ncbi:MAG: serine hydrolase [Pseudomonadota bacterium]